MNAYDKIDDDRTMMMHLWLMVVAVHDDDDCVLV